MSREGENPAPRPAGTGPNEEAAAKPPFTDQSSCGGRQNRSELPGQLGRLVLNGPAPAAQRLRVAADEAAALVITGALDRTGAVAALYVLAQAAGIGDARALAAIAAAFRWAKGGPS